MLFAELVLYTHHLHRRILLSMSETKNTKKLDLENLHEVMQIGMKKLLVDKSISESQLDEVLGKMKHLSLEDKEKFATQLLTILKTSKTPEEILEREKQIVI